MIFKTNSQNIIINLPGYNGALLGYNHKYEKIAINLAKSGLASVVLMDNEVHVLPHEYPAMIVSKLKDKIAFVLEHAVSICGCDDPNIYLIGTSAGGAAVAYVADVFKEVKKILLVAPSFNIDHRDVFSQLNKFTGDVTIAAGYDDTVTGVDVADEYLANTKNAKSRKIVRINDCDHHFTGTENGKILSSLPFFAFNEKYMDLQDLIDNGIELY